MCIRDRSRVLVTAGSSTSLPVRETTSTFRSMLAPTGSAAAETPAGAGAGAPPVTGSGRVGSVGAGGTDCSGTPAVCPLPAEPVAGAGVPVAASVGVADAANSPTATARVEVSCQGRFRQHITATHRLSDAPHLVAEALIRPAAQSTPCDGVDANCNHTAGGNAHPTAMVRSIPLSLCASTAHHSS